MRTALILAFLASISTVFAATIANDSPASSQQLDASTAGLKKLPPKVIKKPYPVKVPVEKKVPVPKPYPVKQPAKLPVKVPVKVPPPKKQSGGYKNHEDDTNIFIEGGFNGFGGHGIGGLEGLGAERTGLGGLGGLGEEILDISAATIPNSESDHNEASVAGKAYGGYGAGYGRYPAYGYGPGKKLPPKKLPIKKPSPKKQGGGYKNEESDTNIFIEGGFNGFGGRGIGNFEGLGAESGLGGLGGLGDGALDVSAAAITNSESNTNEASIAGKAYHGAYGNHGYPGYAAGGYGYGAPYGAYGGYGKKAPPKKQGGYKNHEDSTNVFIENGFNGIGGRGIGAFEGLGAEVGGLDGGLGGI
ncbi:hypothetical protein HDU76_011020 [Blyttiomyces sp. JEL0837]|nr:hypothetical protein HDU76_011020 [Blyttiomyces sp. JEL0837]